MTRSTAIGIILHYFTLHLRRHDTIYRVYSMTKPVTAVLALRFVEVRRRPEAVVLWTP